MVDASSDSEALKLIIDLVKIVSLEFLVSGGELHTLVPLNIVTRKLKKGLFFLQYTTPYQTITNLSLKEKKN